MAIEIPAKLVEFILLGPEGDRRQLQDSPLLGDVWLALAKEPGKRLELLISPYKEQPAGKLAATLAGELEKKAQQSAKAPRRKGAKRAREAADEANVAYLQGIVAASLDVTSILEFIVPKTDWWARHYTDLRRYFTDPKALEPAIDHIYEEAMEWQSGAAPGKRAPTAKASAYQRYVALAALLLWAEDASHSLDAETAGEAAAKLTKAMATVGAPKTGETPWIWNVFLNRTATPAVAKSVPAVKGDAARSLFHVDCSKIVWAVVDSGVAGDHQAFQGKDRRRVLRSFDFTRIREIVSLSNQSEERAQAQAARLVREELLEKPRLDTARSHLKRLAADAEEGRRIDWGLVEPFIEIKVETPPHANHGTHVAGILGAGILGAGILGAGGPEAQGMCPDIGIYDLRVLGPTLAETEFAIIAALQYIRYLNARNSYPTVHGANLSLSIPHEVRNFGCGHTPVCEECERLVNSGVVVVAAAGNRGYQHYETSEGRFDSYAASSITDPGNGDSVITVGSTHRFSPHTYGVSFFSSRGPTGDGRMKPDLVAPGERIRSTLPGDQWGDLDGTSMAAPHVSGAAAMLMARYPELVGQPRRIKQILCDTATDLGREKSFQGRGMLDVLRAFQSV